MHGHKLSDQQLGLTDCLQISLLKSLINIKIWVLLYDTLYEGTFLYLKSEPQPLFVQVDITSDQKPVAGQDYVLTCTASLQGKESDTDTSLTITWMGPGINMDGVTMGTPSSTDGIHASTLTFSPLKQAHGGNYTCLAVFGEFIATKSTFAMIAVMGR